MAVASAGLCTHHLHITRQHFNICTWIDCAHNGWLVLQQQTIGNRISGALNVSRFWWRLSLFCRFSVCMCLSISLPSASVYISNGWSLFSTKLSASEKRDNCVCIWTNNFKSVKNHKTHLSEQTCRNWHEQQSIGGIYDDYYATKMLITAEFSIQHVIMTILQQENTHTHTHTQFIGPFPELPRWAGTRKVKPIWILLKEETVSGNGISWAIY